MKKHAAELAVELAEVEMEKQGIAFTTAALLGLAAAPTITHGLNWLTGHDPKNKIEEQKAKAKAQAQAQQAGALTPPSAAPQLSMPQLSFRQRFTMPGGADMFRRAQGLHAYRSGV